MAVASTVRDLIIQARAEDALSPVLHTSPLDFDNLEILVGELTTRLQACAVFNHHDQERDTAA